MSAPTALIQSYQVATTEPVTIYALADPDTGVTPAEIARLRAIGTASPNPPVHHGEKNPRTKLSHAQVRTLREQAAAGEDLRSLAAEFGITPASVTQLVTGKFRLTAGGPIREAQPRSKLTAKDVAEIRRLAADGVRQVDLARRYGVHPSHISDLVRRRRWTMDKEG